MVQFTTRILQARLNVFGLQIGKLLQDLRRGQSVRQEVQDVNDPDAHASDAGPSAALLRVYRDAIHASTLQRGPGVCTCELACAGKTQGGSF